MVPVLTASAVATHGFRHDRANLANLALFIPLSASRQTNCYNLCVVDENRFDVVVVFPNMVAGKTQ